MNEENAPAPNVDEPLDFTQPPKKSTWKAVAKEVTIFVIIAFGVVLPFRIYIAEPYLVDGRSMDPTFATSDYLIVDKLSYEIGTPQRNTVIVFRYPNDPSKSFIKRIIGLPNETVTMLGNIVTIVNKDNPNGFIIDQSYVVNQCDSAKFSCISLFQKTLGPDEYFVMGDNRAESFDSRSWGPLNKKYILGKPIIRLFPITKIGILPGADSK
ncbi:MAG TPA: signal peptidase I [Candidatus Paceibacterota bacterium]